VEPLLEARRVSTGYGRVAVIHDLDLAIGGGEVVALLGPNGAGKTTVLRTLAGSMDLWSGQVLWHGQPQRGAPHQRARAGLRVLTAEKSVVRSLTVLDNLRLGRSPIRSYLAFFPELEALLGRRSGLLSGGEQQMLALALCLGDDPKVLLADELSLGLAPLVLNRLLGVLRHVADEGMGVLLIEQQMKAALSIADRGCILQRGEVVLQGTATELRSRVVEVERAYLAESALTDAVAADGAGSEVPAGERSTI